jgi:hypothetical protein
LADIFYASRVIGFHENDLYSGAWLWRGFAALRSQYPSLSLNTFDARDLWVRRKEQTSSGRAPSNCCRNAALSRIQQVSSYDNNKVDDAILVLCYSSSAQLEDVKGFYSRTVNGRAWITFTVEEPEHNILQGDDLAFRKGQYMIGIKQDGGGVSPL